MKTEFFLNSYFVASLFFGLLSVLAFEFKRVRVSLVLLLISSTLIGLFIAHSDPFLHIWDEQYHALVAKNLIEFPFKPMLIKEPVFEGATMWSSQHVWLHKQPLFLWQIATSLKIFGLNELGVRFPSIILHALLIVPIYRFGRIISSKEIGYYSSLLFTFSYFPLEYISGSYATDHNDTAFLFFSFSSIWALLELYTSKNRKFIVLIGLLAGCAILCKWLTGLLVYGIWSLLIYFNRKKDRPATELLYFLLSLSVCFLIFMPWQIFCLIKYPLEYALSMDFNFKHIVEPLEGHDGNIFFYYKSLYEQFGEGFLTPPLVLFCFFYMLYAIKDRNNRIVLFFTTLIIYLFFSIVRTKMHGYVFVALPLFILGLSFTFHSVVEKLTINIHYVKIKRIAIVILLISVTTILFNSSKIYKRHSNKESQQARDLKIKEKQMFLDLSKNYSRGTYLIFNCNTTLNSHILAIFYTGFPAFKQILLESQIVEAKKIGYTLIAIEDGNLPQNIINDNTIVKVKF